MSKHGYSVALKAAQDELQDLLEQQEQIQERIEGLNQTISGLKLLLHKEMPPEQMMGLTEAIRAILQKKKDMGYVPIGVRTQLNKAKFDLSKYRSALSVIHTVLKRLVEAGEARTFIRDGRTYYTWKEKVEASTATATNVPSVTKEIIDKTLKMIENLNNKEQKDK